MPIWLDVLIYVCTACLAGLWMPPRRRMKITNRVLLQYALGGVIIGTWIGLSQHRLSLSLVLIVTGWFTLWGLFVKWTQPPNNP